MSPARPACLSLYGCSSLLPFPGAQSTHLLIPVATHTGGNRGARARGRARSVEGGTGIVYCMHVSRDAAHLSGRSCAPVRALYVLIRPQTHHPPDSPARRGRCGVLRVAVTVRIAQRGALVVATARIARALRHHPRMSYVHRTAGTVVSSYCRRRNPLTCSFQPRRNRGVWAGERGRCREGRISCTTCMYRETWPTCLVGRAALVAGRSLARAGRRTARTRQRAALSAREPTASSWRGHVLQDELRAAGAFRERKSAAKGKRVDVPPLRDVVSAAPASPHRGRPRRTGGIS